MDPNQNLLPGSPDPTLFQNLVNLIGANRQVLGQVARYAPGAATSVGQFLQGDIAGGLGAAGGTYAAGQIAKRLVGAIPATTPLGIAAKGAIYAGSSLLGGSVGAQLGKGTAALGNQLIGGTQTAVQDATTAIAGAQREAGTAAGTGKEAGLGGMSQEELNKLLAIKAMGVNAPAEAMERSFQVVNKMKDRDVGRQMQMNQQLAGLTAQLQRNLGGMQLAGQAMSVGGQLTGQMLTSNPYAASVLQTGVRGPLG